MESLEKGTKETLRKCRVGAENVNAKNPNVEAYFIRCGVQQKEAWNQKSQGKKEARALRVDAMLFQYCSNK